MISVIIPVYNAAAYLQACVDSVPSRPDVEVVLVDDGSTDGSVALCDSIASRNGAVRVVHRENGGLAAARNTGIAAARGEWLTFLDADDELLPGALDVMLRVAASTGAAIVTGTLHNAVAIGVTRCARHPDVTVLTPRDAVEAALYQRGDVSGSACGKLIAASLFRDEKFREGTWYEDLDIFYRLFLDADKVAVIHSPVYFYRRNPSSFINTFSPRRLDVLEVTDRLLRYVEANEPSLVPAARSRRFSACFNMFLLLCRHRAMPERQAECWSVIRKYRWAELLDRRTRLKNRLGAALSYGGRWLVSVVLRLV